MVEQNGLAYVIFLNIGKDNSMKNLIVICLMIFMVGCANASRKVVTTVIAPDGTKTITEDGIKISSVGQDFKGSDLTFSHKVGGETKAKAGAVENSMSPVVIDTSKNLVDTIKAFAELYKEMQKVTPAPNTP